MNWLEINKEKPDEEQKVIYFFEHTGVNRGKYKTIEYSDIFGKDEDGNNYKGDMFYSEKGFLTDDVTHWMPDNGQNLPSPPLVNDIIVRYLKNKFDNLDSAKVWLSEFSNNDHQVIQDGPYKGFTFTINATIKFISCALGEYVENAFDSKYYWQLRDYYEENIKI